MELGLFKEKKTGKKENKQAVSWEAKRKNETCKEAFFSSSVDFSVYTGPLSL